MKEKRITIKPNNVLTLTADEFVTGGYWYYRRNADDRTHKALAAGASVEIGPFNVPTQIAFYSRSGQITDSQEVYTQKSIVGGDNAYFYAVKDSQQSFDDATITKVSFETIQADPLGDFDNSSTYRYTPSVEGYYCIHWGVYLLGMFDNSYINTWVTKNGVTIAENVMPVGASFTGGNTGSAFCYMDGVDDYLEVWLYHFNSGQARDSASDFDTQFFAAHKITS